MNRKSFLVALILLLVSASGTAAHPQGLPAGRAALPYGPAMAPSIAASAAAYAQGGCFVAGMNGGNVTLATTTTQAVDTPAKGIGAFVLSPSDPLTTTRKLTYSIAYTGTLGPETDAAIHRGTPGAAGPSIITLPPGNPKQGTISLTEQNVADLLAGILYVNISTVPNATGEIRGQILPGGGCFSASISGASQVPESHNTGKGIGTFLLVPPDPLTTTRKLVYDIEFSGLLGPETSSGIHKGAVKVSGPVVEPLPPGSPKQGVLDIEAQAATDLLSGLLYVNISSLVLMNGEIRGQILPFGGGCYSATLSGRTETPPNASTATGGGTFFLSPTTLTTTVTTTLKLAHVITYSTTLTPTMAHLHKAPPGVPGPIAVPLPLSRPISGTLTLTQAQAADLIQGLYYVNIHTAGFTQGEIRGQIVQSKCMTVFLPFAGR
ncbi:MAG TPA: CHRD domain-containing protein [Roseiflexaceae bacterium]|nr:CHRD domain-containing protein [Roseiflexaceae bacterium]